MDAFTEALEFTLRWEGGHVDDPADPGGETIYGISKQAHPDLWCPGPPTRGEAVERYREQYWGPVAALPYPLNVCVFDAGVNMGVTEAVRLLQILAGFRGRDVDGIAGPKTCEAAVSLPSVTAHRLNAARIVWYRGLVRGSPRLNRFLRGWINRVNDLDAWLGARAEA